MEQYDGNLALACDEKEFKTVANILNIGSSSLG